MASSAVDTFCRQVIGATLDTQADSYPVRRGVLKIKLDNTPILQVVDVQVGITPSGLTSLNDLSGVWIGKKVITVPVANFRYVNSSAPMLPTGRMYAVTQYVNGYANSLLSVDVEAGDMTFTPDSPLGIFPGMTVTVYDPGSSEQVTIASVDADTFTLAAPFTSNHAQGVAVSTLPPAVKEAAILYTTMLIKTRADDSFVMPAIGSEPSQETKTSSPGGPEQQLAEQLLLPHRRVA
jgi:hypothetical protein